MALDSEYKKRTAKSIVIERIFNQRWNSATNSLRVDRVTIKDVSQAIKQFNKKPPIGMKAISDGNPANFFKDFVRVTSSANRNWPETILRRGYTARQETGGGGSFRFVRLPAGQMTAFEEAPQHYPRLDGKECRFRIQSLSLDVKSRLLGRRDESWLMQVAVKLKLVQSHLALCSENKFVEVSDLQQNIKQSGAEIDGLFLGKITPHDAMLITLEAKGRKDDILEDQIAAQVSAIMRMKRIHKNLAAIAGDVNNFYVLPMAMKVIDNSVVYMAEYEPVQYQYNNKISAVTLRSESLCEIVPPVEGIH
jgi:hypothetical protein